jgi:hypothetical protein
MRAIATPCYIATYIVLLLPSFQGMPELHLRPVIDGITWMEDEDVYVVVAVR